MMLGIIPARKGSKGIIDKNIKNMCGKPLIQWTIDAVKGIMPVIITTDYEHDFGIEKIKRPDYLCKDDTPMLPVIQHAIKEYEKYHFGKVTSVCLLQPTSPLRLQEDIDSCIFLHVMKCKPVMSGYSLQIKEDGKVFDKHKVGYHFQRNGAIFIATRKMIDNGEVFNQYSLRYEMPFSRSIDIDSDDDWFVAESILKNR